MHETPAEPFPGPLTELPLERVDVWIVSLGEAGLTPDPADWLSADERARAARYAFERDWRRYSLGRGALRGILATYLRCDRAEIVFAYGETGKPRWLEPTPRAVCNSTRPDRPTRPCAR